MRIITEHCTNPVNKAITVTADDQDPENGNASHKYGMAYQHGTGETSSAYQTLLFQHGPIGEVGVNGVTNEVLLVIVADRLRGFQSSKFACVENAAALSFVENALAALESRTRNREARQVEGTHEV